MQSDLSILDVQEVRDYIEAFIILTAALLGLLFGIGSCN
jgi:hypothetical protein